MKKFEVTELKGYKSLTALNAFHTLMLGLKMLPDYLGLQYEEFFESIEKASTEQQEKLIRKAALFVKLERDELEALVCFVKDKNGVPYSAENIKNLGPDDLHEIIVSVCVAISRIKVNFISSSEKKN